MGKEKLTKENEEDLSQLLRVPGKIKEKLFETFSSFPIPPELERKVEGVLNRTLTLFNIPSQEEIKKLNLRIDELLARCEEIEHEESILDSSVDSPPKEQPKST